MQRKLSALIALTLVCGVAFWALQQRMTAPPANPANEAEPMVDVELPELSAQAKAGAQIFESRCSQCHGPNGSGNLGAGPPLIHKIYEPGHHGDTAFLIAARDGVRAHHWNFGDMPPVEGVEEDEVQSIIVYIREIQRHNGIN